jgi:hypothetical protein
MTRVRAWQTVLIVAAVSGITLAAQTPPTKPLPKKKPAAATAPAKVEPTSEPALPPPTDVRIRTRYTSGAQVSENTTFIKGPRQRVEFPGVTSIDQCDLHRTVLLNGASKKYMVQPYAETTASSGVASAQPSSETVPPGMESQMAMMGMGRPPQEPKGGVITYTATRTDTGERKQVFGFEARRIRTVVLREASASACDKSSARVEVDGWYVDLPNGVRCSRTPAPAAPPAAAQPQACVDRVETRTVGDAKLGFPVVMMTTTTAGEGDKQEVTSTSMEVTDLEVTRLDETLFDVPADYAEAKSSVELMPVVAAGGSLSDALLGSTADGTGSAAPKKPGLVRIGVLEPVNKASQTLPTRQLRQELVGEFRKAPFEAVALAGQSPVEIEKDARRLECDYILYSEIADIKTSKPGKVGGLLKKASGEGPARDTVEARLDYKLYAVGDTASPKMAATARANSGGGFGAGSALRLAAFAGSMYMGFGMMRGFGLGMFNPMLSMPGLGSGLFDPRLSAMSSMTQMAMSGGMGGVAGTGAPAFGDPSEATLRQTVGQALSTEAKAAMAQLQNGKK